MKPKRDRQDEPAEPPDPEPAEPQDAGQAEAAESDKPRGMKCPRCGCEHFLTVYTRPGDVLVATRDPKGRQVVRRAPGVTRRRECRHCGHRMTTVERPVSAGEPCGPAAEAEP